jgi:hypothetical protein
MTGMANLIIELVYAWLNLTGYLSVVKVESQRLFTIKNLQGINNIFNVIEHLKHLGLLSTGTNIQTFMRLSSNLI